MKAVDEDKCSLFFRVTICVCFLNSFAESYVKVVISCVLMGSVSTSFLQSNMSSLVSKLFDFLNSLIIHSAKWFEEGVSCQFPCCRGLPLTFPDFLIGELH